MRNRVRPRRKVTLDHLIRVLFGWKLQYINLRVHLLFQPDHPSWFIAPVPPRYCMAFLHCRHGHNFPIKTPQGLLYAMLSSGSSRCIRVKSQRHLLRQLLQLLDMLLGDGTANTSDRLLCPKLMGNHRVHITLDDNHLLLKLDCVPCQVQGIKHRIFFKEQCLRRIEILWLIVTHSTTTKTNHMSPRIPDRKNDTMPKVIIDPATFTAATLSLVSRFHLILGITGFRSTHRLPCTRIATCACQPTAHQFPFAIALT